MVLNVTFAFAMSCYARFPAKWNRFVAGIRGRAEDRSVPRGCMPTMRGEPAGYAGGFRLQGIVNSWAGTNGSAGCWTFYER
jgi:hypothetical protein